MPKTISRATSVKNAMTVFGSRMNSMITGPNFDDFGRDAKVVLVDIDVVEHRKPGRKFDLHLELDLKIFLKELNSRIEFKAPAVWKNYCQIV